MTVAEYLIQVGKLALEKAQEESDRYEADAIDMLRQAREAQHRHNQHQFQIHNLKALTQLRYNQLMKSMKKKPCVDPEIARVMNLKYEEACNAQ